MSALVTVFASMVPFVGAAGVWVPGTVYLLAIGAWPKAIVLAVWGAAVVAASTTQPGRHPGRAA